MSDQAHLKASRRPIDLLRNSGGVMEVGTAEDGPIVAILPTNRKLYFVKTRAIYSVQLADQIDPERTNANIPNAQQRELAIGSDHFAVARILLTAEKLLKKTALGQSFDVKQGIEIAIDLLKDVGALVDTRERLEVSQRDAMSTYTSERPLPRYLQLPSIENIEFQCDAFAQKAAHVVAGLERLSKQFYPTELESKWIDSLIRTVRNGHGAGEPLVRYLEKTRSFLMFVITMRNLIEHPKPTEFLKVHNFRLLPSGELEYPSVEIVRPGFPVETEQVTVMMESITEHLVNVCEAFFAYLCGLNTNGCGALLSTLTVVIVPPGKRQHPEVKFSYAYYDGKDLIPISVG